MDRQTKLDVLQKEFGRQICKSGIDDIWEDDSILSDVLVWLNKVGYCATVWTENNKLVIYNKKTKYQIELNIDLTKPYLSEQSDEVVDGLYEVYLLTKKD